MACFNNGKQKLNSSDRTYDLKSKVIFNHNSERYENFLDNNINIKSSLEVAVFVRSIYLGN